MTTKDEDAELVRILAMTKERLRAQITAQGLDWDTEVAKLKSISEEEPVEQLEKALFGASLDDILDLSEFTDMEIRLAGFRRQNQKADSETTGPARSSHDRSRPTHRDDSAQAREAVVPSHTARKSNER